MSAERRAARRLLAVDLDTLAGRHEGEAAVLWRVGSERDALVHTRATQVLREIASELRGEGLP